jgi:proteasome assembly chaperone 3
MTELGDTVNPHDLINLPFPAATKQAAGVVNGILTDVMSINFSDKILVTISQRGKLVHWVRFEYNPT